MFVWYASTDVDDICVDPKCRRHRVLKHVLPKNTKTDSFHARFDAWPILMLIVNQIQKITDNHFVVCVCWLEATSIRSKKPHKEYRSECQNWYKLNIMIWCQRTSKASPFNPVDVSQWAIFFFLWLTSTTVRRREFLEKVFHIPVQVCTSAHPIASRSIWICSSVHIPLKF